MYFDFQIQEYKLNKEFFILVYFFYHSDVFLLGNPFELFRYSSTLLPKTVFLKLVYRAPTSKLLGRSFKNSKFLKLTHTQTHIKPGSPAVISKNMHYF